jgi:hypothetical protein
MSKTWISTARATILEDHRDQWDTTDGAARLNMLRLLKMALKDAPGRKLPKKMNHVGYCEGLIAYR